MDTKWVHIISCTKRLSFLDKNLLHTTKLYEYTDSAVEDLSSRCRMGQMCITDADTSQNNFILSAPPVGGLPISQDWRDTICLFATAPFQPSWKEYIGWYNI